MGESANNTGNNSNFDISKELSTLVAKKTLPNKIAVKLEQKLKERNVTLTKEQFYLLIDKLTNVLKNYKNQNGVKSANVNNTGMDRLVETIENLEERLSKIENKELEVPGYNKPRVATTGEVTVPYGDNWNWEPLKNIPTDPESIIILMKWLQYLIDRCGRDNLSNILVYYVDIGWISQDVKINLIDYSQGITDENKKDTSAKKNITDLPSKDHVQSFIFIQKLKGVNLDKHFIDRIDEDLSRITKKLESYNFN